MNLVTANDSAITFFGRKIDYIQNDIRLWPWDVIALITYELVDVVETNKHANAIFHLMNRIIDQTCKVLTDIYDDFDEDDIADEITSHFRTVLDGAKNDLPVLNDLCSALVDALDDPKAHAREVLDACDAVANVCEDAANELWRKDFGEIPAKTALIAFENARKNLSVNYGIEDAYALMCLAEDALTEAEVNHTISTANYAFA